jgi:uncharacterized protein
VDSDAPLPPGEPATSLQPAAPPPSTVHKVFMGKDGLRAVWSVLIFIAIFVAFMAATFFVARKLHLVNPRVNPGAEIPLKSGTIQESIAVFFVLLVTWIMSKIERRGRSYGYGGAHKLKYFLAGMAWGLILISILVFALWKSGLLIFERRLIFGSEVFQYGALWLVGFCLVGVFEESITRGFLLYTLTRGFSGLYLRAFKTRHSAGLGFWTSAVILSVIFFLGHTKNPGESPVGLLSVFVAGMFLCFSIWRSGSIWWAIGMHATWDWGQSFLFGVADSGIMMQHHLLATHPHGQSVLSGGTTGPEGSILVLAVLALGCVGIIFTIPRAHYGDGATDAPQPTASAVV